MPKNNRPNRKSGGRKTGKRTVADKTQSGRAEASGGVPGTSTHQMQETILKRNVLCVIDRAFRVTGPAMRPKR